MVVVPKRTSVLLVRVVVVFVLTRLSNILCPAVKGRARVGAMEVDRIRELGVVDEANDGLGVFRDDEGWPRGNSIVSNKLSGLWEVWVDLLFKWLDFNLIVENFFPCDRTCDIPEIFDE